MTVCTVRPLVRALHDAITKSNGPSYGAGSLKGHPKGSGGCTVSVQGRRRHCFFTVSYVQDTPYIHAMGHDLFFSYDRRIFEMCFRPPVIIICNGPCPRPLSMLVDRAASGMCIQDIWRRPLRSLVGYSESWRPAFFILSSTLVWEERGQHVIM